MTSTCVCYRCNADLYTVAYLLTVDAATIEVGTQQANGSDCRPQYTQRASSRHIVAGRPGECKIN